MYELYIALTLGRNITLSPYMDNDYVRWASLDRDVCIASIGKAVNSKFAFCSDKNDKDCIHEAILSSSKDGFLSIDQSVEEIRLAYLLDYPYDKIEGDSWSKEPLDLQVKSALELLETSIRTVVLRLYDCEKRSIPQYQYDDSDPKSAFKQWLEEIKQFLNSSEKRTDAKEISLSIFEFDSILDSIY